MSLSQATMKIEVKKGLTVAILDCLIQAKEPMTSGNLSEMITKAGRGTNVQEVSSLLVTIQNSQVNKMLEIGRMRRENLYSIKPEFTGASLEQVQKVYLKRIKYSPEDLLKDLGKENTGNSPPASLGVTTGSLTGNPEVKVTGKRIVFILEDQETEIVIRYKGLK